jgi:hypothetical protein
MALKKKRGKIKRLTNSGRHNGQSEKKPAGQCQCNRDHELVSLDAHLSRTTKIRALRPGRKRANKDKIRKNAALGDIANCSSPQNVSKKIFRQRKLFVNAN